MDFDQLQRDLTGLTRMAVSSRDHLVDLTERVATLRERLQEVIAAVEPQDPPSEPSPRDA